MKLVTILTLCIFTIVVGCAGLETMDPSNIKGAHARARFVNVTYQLAFMDYQRFAGLKNLTPEAVELLKSKRIALALIHLPIAVLNGHAETGTITDAAFNALLDKLLELETGWYVATAKDQTDDQVMSKANTFAMNPTVTDDHLMRALIESGLIEGNTKNPMITGVLIELLRMGIHAVRAMLSQRGLDEAQMLEAWQASWDTFKTLNPNNLIVL